jgi:hypothetical protein
MMTNKLFFRLVALLLLMGCRAEALSFRIEAKISITNTPATSNLLTLNGQSKMWRTTILDATTQMQITNSIGGHRTNLYNHCNSYPFTNNISVSYGTNTNDVILLGQKNQPMLASLSGTWGFITFKTNAVYDGETQAAGTNNVGRASMTNEASATVAMMPASTNRIPAGITAMDHFVDKTSSGSVSNKNLVGGSLSNTVAKRLEVIAQTTSRGGGYLDFSWAAPQSGVDPSGNGSGLRFYDGTTNTFIMLTWNGEDPYVTMRWGTNTGDGPFDPIDIGPAVDVSSLVDLTVEQSAGLLLNAKSATHMFPIMDGAAISFGASGWTNNWKSINIFTTSTNEFNTLTKFNGGVYMLSGFGSNMFFLRPTISNAVAITVTNLQAFGGYLSNFFSQNIVSSNTASYNNLLGGTSVITGMLSLGPATAISSIAAGGNFLDVGTNTHIRLTGTPGTNWTLTGIKQGSRTPQDGDMVLIEGDTGFSATIANESALVTTGNEFQRIRTYNGGDTTSSGDFLALAYYKGSIARWQWAWWNRGSGTGSGSQATNVINTGNMLWVDGRNGDDSAAQPSDLTHRYKTLGAAKTNANPGDTICVLPAVYPENNLMKSNVSYHFFAGAVVSNTVPTNTAPGWGIFDDRPAGAAGPFTVTGGGEFIFRNSNPANSSSLGAIALTNPISRLTLKGKRLIGSSRDTVFFNLIYVANCQMATIELEEMSDTFEQWSDLDPMSPTFTASGANGIYWESGEMHCQIGRNLSSRYCIWSRDIGNTTNSLYYKGNLMVSSNLVTLYAQGGSAARGNLRTWVDCLELYGSAITVSGLGAVKMYVTAQKISSGDTAIDASCELWLNAQKVSAAGKWVNKLVVGGGGLSVQNAFIQVQQFEDLGTGMAEGIFNSSTNDLHIIGGKIKGNGSFGTLVKHAGTGRTILDGMTVDGSAGGASGYPVTVSSNGLIVRSSRILAGSAPESIHTNGVGANIVDLDGLSSLNKDVSPTLIVSNGFYRVTGSTNLFSGTNFAGAMGDVLSKGPAGLYLATPAAPGIGTLNGNGTNLTVSANATTVPPLRVNVSSTHATNVQEIYRDTSMIAGFDKDGFAFMRPTNSAVIYPATYSLWVQDTDGSDTNVINTQTSMLGTGVIGSKTFPTNFWRHGRQGVLEFEGQAWAPGTGGNCAFYAYAGSTLLNTGIAAPLANAAGDQYLGRLVLTCITNSSGTNLNCVGRITFGTSTRCTFTNMLTLLTDPTSPMAVDVKSTNATATHSILGKSGRLMMTP